ncbi:MAG: hypothetical protein JSV80_09555 [Acidobacteriota bacterium]|nr:MAG: hypothetical protein JSV80_09555 [Acidobacteriota bacterium]
MTKMLLLAQLAFNVVMLLALLHFARGSSTKRGESRPRHARRDGTPVPAHHEAHLSSKPTKRAAHDEIPAHGQPGPNGPSHLDALVERADREQLVAEKALRERLARFRERVAS